VLKQNVSGKRSRSEERVKDNRITKKKMGKCSSTSGLTIPKTPQLLSKTRSRPTNILRHEDYLEKCLKDEIEAKKAEAKAREAEKIRLNKQHTGKCVATRPTTVAEPFQLSSTNARRLPTTASSTPPTFTAQPIPTRLLKTVTGLPDRKAAPVVIPESPAFATKQRQADKKAAALIAKVVPRQLAKPKPAPHHGVPVVLPPTSKTKTVPEPFSFYNRDKDVVKNKEDKIKKFIQDENALREFHAAPIMQNQALPEKKTAPATKPQPFQHNIEERVEPRLARWTESIEQQFQQEQNDKEFKANKALVLQKKPFIPEPSSKPLAEVQNVILHSEERAMQRENWTMSKADNEAKLQAAMRERDVRRKLEEEKQVAKMRKETVHKAQPIRSYREVTAMEAKPLTKPESPAFATRQRAQCRKISH